MAHLASCLHTKKARMLAKSFARFFALPRLLVPHSPRAQAAVPDTPEPGSVEEIARATTEARFLSPWVVLPAGLGEVVSPRAFLHRIPGAPGRTGQLRRSAYAYCRALAGSSPRVQLFTIGRSEEGRDIVLLAIADEKGIAELEQLKAATAALADPRKTDPAAAEQLIAHARARSTTSTPRCTRTRPARPSRCSSSPTGWRSPSSR